MCATAALCVRAATESPVPVLFYQPPKMDPTAIVEVLIRVKGGEVPGGASLAPKIGPLGMVRPGH